MKGSRKKKTKIISKACSTLLDKTEDNAGKIEEREKSKMLKVVRGKE